VAAPTIEASLDGRFISGLKSERVKAADFFKGLGLKEPTKAEVGGHARLCSSDRGEAAARSWHRGQAMCMQEGPGSKTDIETQCGS
jgi:hypothetical protein